MDVGSCCPQSHPGQEEVCIELQPEALRGSRDTSGHFSFTSSDKAAINDRHPVPISKTQSSNLEHRLGRDLKEAANRWTCSGGSRGTKATAVRHAGSARAATEQRASAVQQVQPRLGLVLTPQRARSTIYSSTVNCKGWWCSAGWGTERALVTTAVTSAAKAKDCQTATNTCYINGEETGVYFMVLLSSD